MKSFKVGEAPWETGNESKPSKTTAKGFKVGEAPWEVEQPKKASRTIETALEGFGEGATLGYLNNLQALADKPVTAIGNLLTGNNVEADDYVTARDGYNKRQEELKAENPKASFPSLNV